MIFSKGMLVFDIANPVSMRVGNTVRWVIHPWREAVMEQQPELVRDAYLAIAQLRLFRNEQSVDGLRELLHEPEFAPDRPAIVLYLLQQFPNANPSRLR